MMSKFHITSAIAAGCLVICSFLFFRLDAQPTGYYNGTEGKDGSELKGFLHALIDDHQVFSYYSSKEMMKYSDQDPEDPDHVILVYTRTSHPNSDYGTGNNQLNREHVWAKSHGTFEDVLPMYSDVHNLKPCDASVNVDKGHKDFDAGGIPHLEAIGCYYTQYTWEPGDLDKGDIARIIFYMAVRYEGDQGEINLEVVDEVNTHPKPEHGRLSTLLQWNMQDPPDAFEMNRNHVIYAWQNNRNPFIDHPEFAGLIWGGDSASPLMIGDIQAYPLLPDENQEVFISADIKGNELPVEAILLWGFDRYELNDTLDMEVSSGHYYSEITGQSHGTTVFYRIHASDGIHQSESVTYSLTFQRPFSGTVTSIYDIQGQQEISPYNGLTVSASGVVTATFGEYYYLQQGQGAWNGIRVWDPSRCQRPGDSVIITGMVTEVEEVTVIHNVTDYYLVASARPLPQPEVLTCSQVGESFEGLLIEIRQAECIESNYYENDWRWIVNDGTGTLQVFNTSIFEYNAIEGEWYTLKGPVHYSGDVWMIELRSDEDVAQSQGFAPPSNPSHRPDISLWTDPVRNLILIESNETKSIHGTYQIIHLTGQLAGEGSLCIQTGANTIDLDGISLTKGLYIFSFCSTSSRITWKLIIH